MANIDVNVDIDIAEHLGECSLDELKQEIRERGCDVVTGIQIENKQPKLLLDKMKVEMFEDKYKDIPIAELEKFLKKYK